MKRLAAFPTVVVVLLTFSLAIYAQPAASPNEETFKQIKQQLGVVPSYLKAVPDEVVAPAWEQMRILEMGETTLPAKTKELIALAVSAQIPCKYCIYADTQFAKSAGATEREIKEAIGMSAITRHWSTILNGMNVDEAAFDKDTQKIFTYLSKNKPAPSNEQVTDAASAQKDMERTLGSMPMMFTQYPQVALAPAWREMKGLQLNPQTALNGKTKELIGLAVAAQIPCHYCVKFHTGAARLHGASAQEIQEAVAMAAFTRHWSTIIQGSQQDEAKFKKEVDQAIRNAGKMKPVPKQAVR